MSTARQYLTNLIAQSVGRLCTFGVNFSIFVLIARAGGTEFFGRYSYVITFLNVFTQFADFGMTSVLGKDIAQVQGDKKSYWGNFLVLKTAFSLISVAIAVIAGYMMRKDLFLVLLIGSLFIPFLSARFFEPVFQVHRRPWLSMYSSLLYGAVYLLLSLLALGFSGDLLSVVLAFLIANIVYGVSAYYFTSRLIKPSFVIEPARMKQILVLAVPLGVSAFFTIVSGRVPIFMLAAMKSDFAVGMFNASYRFFEIFVMAGAILVGPFIPILSAKAMHDLASLKRISVMIMELVGIFGVSFAILMTFLAPVLIRTIFGESFVPAAPSLAILMWAGMLVFLSLFMSAVVLSMSVVHFAYWNTAAAAVISILLNYLWIPQYSFVGSAWALLLCEVFLSSTTLVFVIRHVGNPFQAAPWVKIAGANLTLLGILYFRPLGDDHLFLNVAAGVVVYGALIFILKVFPWNAIRLLGEVASKLKVRYAS
ncbi:MAG TPA: flippase [Syntrophorhabdaceae bacterium]|jgi:O-antigen/teichoic acid export membrane protein